MISGLLNFVEHYTFVHKGWRLGGGYMGDDALANWLTYQRRNKSLLERVKQDLLGWIGL